VIFDLDGTKPEVGFPDTRLAESDPNGLLAIGGDLSEARLLIAYRRGIFPWYSVGQPILWWSPAPRMVLYPQELHVSRSLRKSLRNRGFEVSVDMAFDAVIRACAAPRDDSDGTWLVPEMINSYTALHRVGHAHSIETWLRGELVGGLYGVMIGSVFFGESMFSRRSDASKVAFTQLAEIGRSLPLQFIDCQIYTDHLASLGARQLDREVFQAELAKAVDVPTMALRRRLPYPAASLVSAR
jgi:leucyl/phenylalanyl-tRNA--protein transferase